MKKLITLLSLSITFTISAQIKGVVKDSISGKPIPYVNIWVENENIGTTSEENGVFQIDTNEKSKKMIFSAIGFETKKISISNTENVLLKPTSYQLEEVSISKLKQTKEIEIGDSKKKDYSHLSGGLPWIYAKFFSYKEVYNETPYIKEIIVFTKSKIDKATFKIRVYNIGEDGNPSTDLLNEDIVVEAKKGLKENKIDVSKFKIPFPKEGIFIGYEWMIIEKNKYLFEYRDSDKTRKSYFTYAPSVICNEVEFENTFHFTKGKWYKRPLYYNERTKRKDVIEPAINLVLTN